MRIEPCWTKCPAGSDLSAGHHQKSAGHVRHVRHISRSLIENDDNCGSPLTYCNKSDKVKDIIFVLELNPLVLDQDPDIHTWETSRGMTLQLSLQNIMELY